MAEVIISESLKEDVFKKFKQKSIDIFELFLELEQNPKKGKLLSSVGGVLIKELKYSSHRFYFITDGHRLKFGTEDELASLLIKFIRMSDQKKVIDEIKSTLKIFGYDGF
jgi:hypothetical protein